VSRPSDPDITPESILESWLDQAEEMEKKEFVKVRGYEVGVICREIGTLLEMVECAINNPRKWNKYRAFRRRLHGEEKSG
jgi:hypothetical protein